MTKKNLIPVFFDSMRGILIYEDLDTGEFSWVSKTDFAVGVPLELEKQNGKDL